LGEIGKFRLSALGKERRLIHKRALERVFQADADGIDDGKAGVSANNGHVISLYNQPMPV
jgi:hypothetical protein